MTAVPKESPKKSTKPADRRAAAKPAKRRAAASKALPRKPSNPAGVPVWSHVGIVCTGETYKSVVKLTFAKGASLPDPSGLFNSSLEGNTRRAIDNREGEKIDEKALKEMIRSAVALNTSGAQTGTRLKKKS